MTIQTIHEALRWASSFLTKKNLEPPVAEWLLKHYLQVDRTKLLLMLHDPISNEHVSQLKRDLIQHANGVPVQHLIGYEEFYGRRFIVNEHVLIPRPETEELVQTVIRLKQKLFSNEHVTFIDVGTGSGAIAVTIALETEARVIAADISKDALTVAKENAMQLGAKVEFMEGDLLQPLIDLGRKVNIFVSNPPYIPLTEGNQLDVHVKNHEPHLALFGGEDGLAVYRKIMKQLPFVMEEKGIIAFEVGVGQAKTVGSWLGTIFPKATTEIIQDINGKERIVVSYGHMISMKNVESIDV